MMKKILTIGIFGLVLLSSCEQKTEFGESFQVVDAISVDDLYFRLSSAEDANDVVVEGVVDEVCQAKGCWLSLKATEGASMRVTFKDYGFFVPKNISGRKVALKGNGIVSITSVADQQHYAEDAGKSEEEIAEITEPLQEYTFEAGGVQLLD